MLGGFLVFNTDTGAPLYHRRFLPGFGLAGAKQQPSLADPVGLALQLFAFSRFSRDLPGNPRLEQVHFGQAGDKSGVFFAWLEVPDLQKEGQVLTLTLALFGDVPSHLGLRLAQSLLKAIASENTSSLEPAQAAGGPPRPSPRGGVVQWRFKSLDALLDVVPDWLAADLLGCLPATPQWMALLVSDEAVSSAEPRPLTPRPPPGDRPPGTPRAAPLARRLLQRFSPRAQVLSSAEPSARASSAPPRPQIARHASSLEEASAPDTPRSAGLAQGKLSWWWRRGRSTQPPPKGVEAGSAEMQLQAPTFLCYLYGGSDPSGRNLEFEAAAIAMASRSPAHQEAGWALAELKQGEHAKGAQQFATFHSGGRLSVA
ncbi:unnamed protein product, partial [Polarella glacialis]